MFLFIEQPVKDWVAREQGEPRPAGRGRKQVMTPTSALPEASRRPHYRTPVSFTTIPIREASQLQSGGREAHVCLVAIVDSVLSVSNQDEIENNM